MGIFTLMLLLPRRHMFIRSLVTGARIHYTFTTEEILHYKHIIISVA